MLRSQQTLRDDKNHLSTFIHVVNGHKLRHVGQQTAPSCLTINCVFLSGRPASDILSISLINIYYTIQQSMLVTIYSVLSTLLSAIYSILSKSLAVTYSILSTSLAAIYSILSTSLQWRSSTGPSLSYTQVTVATALDPRPAAAVDGERLETVDPSVTAIGVSQRLFVTTASAVQYGYVGVLEVPV